ncbi:PHA/PHB synthase family protein [Sphingomonas nostoxanthinifaciens]|uniref:PHA/PHB synthase family protein n=1 Tax=Sphingomonas nostoxanthinifaciens TaxID=2872652 RepID=UPI001CC1E7EE|nr:class I poly(R)-hydroxyalkanoic acid synthase [Sphingomonas nostoxanthinifaciens]UAK26231.1 class I poly(R)-hydroxyalkanoic acid synthase [Sphingomonas nostoxanthinifaciens]
MADEATKDTDTLLKEMSHWTGIAGEMQQLMMEHGASVLLKMGDDTAAGLATTPLPSTDQMLAAQKAWWQETAATWRKMMPLSPESAAAATGDRRFAGVEWREPIFDMIRQTYTAIADQLLAGIARVEGLDPKQKEQLLFLTRNFVEAMSPSNFALTNPQVFDKIIETGGRNLVVGLERILADVGRGQISHTAADAFEIGRNIATTPGKVVKETALYQLIHYAPTTPNVKATPLLIFPPWINRFYILDLRPEKSFVRWALDQGLSVFMVSWKSADASMAGTLMDDYILAGEHDAIDTVRDLLNVPSVHVIGYCVAGTAMAMLLAWLAARGEGEKVASATFFTAQVDFSQAGDLSLFVDDAQIGLINSFATDGFLDGRYLAATFNLLRGRDLIWNYVVNNYLLANDYAPFDLLHWNSDVTNLPAEWHRRYLSDLYRDNLLVKAGGLSVAEVPIDLSQVRTPSYVQAGREDHIAPPESVWKLTHHFAGPLRFVLAGSGHIAGVVNPPAANKYGYWTNDAKVPTLAEFVAGATEHKGSWWPDWISWIDTLSGDDVAADGARIPGQGKLPAIEDAPGRYVRTR